MDTVIYMCESTVYLQENDEKIEFMKEVAKIEVTPESIVCFDIIGEKKEIIGGKFKVANLMDHSIIIEK
jgi:predicted RNA-binding protein